jgi:hypothetical protein
MLRFLLKQILLMAVFCGSIVWSAAYTKRCGSDLQSLKKTYEKASPEVVLLGNSLLKAGVDERLLATFIGKKTLKAYSDGASSAYWYLYVKNVLMASEHPPEYLAIFFRDSYLTDPSFRTKGKFQTKIRMISSPDEPLVLSKSYPEQGEKKFSSIWETLSWVQSEARDRFETRTLKTACDICRVNKEVGRQAMRNSFDDSKINTAVKTEEQLASEVLTEESLLNSELQIEKSYLPEIISLLKEKDIKLICVRLRRRGHVDGSGVTDKLQEYIKDLDHYVRNSGNIFLDCSEDQAIGFEHFGAGDHLNATGKAYFTQKLAEDLAPLIPSKASIASSPTCDKEKEY